MTLPDSSPIAAPRTARPKLPRLGLGCGTFGREITEAEAFTVMDHALACGITLFDTAEAYGGGQARAGRRRLGFDDVREVSDEMHSSEKIVGRWLKVRGTRDRIILVTKVSKDFRPASVRAALEASLDRLQTGHVDYYLYHSYDATVPAPEAAASLAAVVRAGLTRAGGVSNYPADRLREFLAAAGDTGFPVAAAAEYCCNLVRTDTAQLSVAREAGLATFGFSPLGAGFLTGKYTRENTTIPRGSRFDVVPAHADLYFHDRGFTSVERLHALAASTGIPAVQLALAWACRHPLVSTVLVGARHPRHLDNAVTAAGLQLPADLWTQLNALA